MSNRIKKEITMKDLKKVVSEVSKRVGGVDEYDRNDLMDIIGDFGLDQFYRGVKFQKIKNE